MRINRLLKSGLASLLLLGAASNAGAESLLGEKFDYAVGSTLLGQGGWLRYGNDSNNPIKIVESTLTYSGYQDESNGKAVALIHSDNGSDQKVYRQFSNTSLTGPIYYSALVNFSYVTSDDSDPFLGLVLDADGTDGVKPTVIASLYAKKAGYGFQIGLKKAGDRQVSYVGPSNLKLDRAYLLVVKYELKDGSYNDVVQLWINPTDTEKEPSSPYTVSDKYINDPSGKAITGLTISQGSTTSKYSCDLTVDAVRAATTWAELFKEPAGETPQPPVSLDPVITAGLQLRFADTNVGSTSTQTLNVKAKDLSEDIAVTIDDDVFTPAVTSIPKEEAMSEAGYDLTVNFTPTRNAAFGSRLNLRSGTAVKYVNLSGNGIAVVDKPEIILTENFYDFDKVYVGETATHTFKIKAKGLTEDINIIPNTLFESVTSIPKDEAMSEAGYDLVVSVTPTVPGLKSGSLTMISSGTYASLNCSVTGVEKKNQNLSVSANSLVFPQIFANLTSTQSIIVKGEGLTEDITVSGLEDPFSVEVETISKEEAMSENGYELFVTFSPVKGGPQLGSLQLTSGDLTANVSLTGDATYVPSYKTANQLQALSEWDEALYTGKATVTYVDKSDNKVYAQDILGGLCLDFSYFNEMPQIKAGDQISGVYGMISGFLGANSLIVFGESYNLVDAQKTVEPIELEAAALKEDARSYIFRLVNIKNVEFTAEGTFSSASFTQGKQNGTQVAVKPFAGTSAEGVAVPALASVTGVSYSASIASLRPRSAEDIVEAAQDPALDIEVVKLFDGEAAPINQDTEVARLIVKATALTKPEMWLGGSGSRQYRLSVETLPDGTFTQEITLIYHPTSVGKHDGTFNIDVNPADLSQRKSFTFYAYDPDNMPAVTVAPEATEVFVAAVGEKMEQTLKVTTANFPDYPSVKVMGEGEGSFVISTTMFMKDGDNTLRVTFQPKAEGEFNERIMIDGLMFEPVYISLKGTTSAGPKPEEKEGDELPLSTLNPLSLLTEDFSSVTEANKPLKLDGWKNLALEGKRAWWGQTLENAGGVAKITAYDSKINPGEGTPARMMLVTPALDFVNSASKMLTFKIMGQNLSEDMTDLLEVVYIDANGDDLYIEPIYNLNIPATADLNNEWVPFVMNLEGQDLADVFFIGFRFTSTRGRDNSAIYYVDDVTYGRTDIPFIQPDRTQVMFEAEKGQPKNEVFAVEGNNLKGEITLTVGGANASNFTVSPATLPAAGGTFTVTFLSDEVGFHEAEILLSAEGAPTTAIRLVANNKNTGSAIEGIDSDNAGAVKAYIEGSTLTVKAPSVIENLMIHNIAGTLVAAASPASATATLDVAALGRGTVILTVVTTDGTTTNIKLAL